MSISESNRAVWERQAVVAEYDLPKPALFAPERFVLEQFERDYVGKRMLDLGVGCGRTTVWFEPRTARYVSLDYSHEMVRRCKERLPQCDVRWGDARDLAAFPDESFDFVLFSFNGIDCMSHADRKQVLAEVHRVLAPGGLFTFSSHCLAFALRRSAIKNALRFGFRSGFRADVRWVVAYATRAVRRLAHYYANRKREHIGEGFAILTDAAHEFQIVGYAIAPETQKENLRDAGFAGPIEVVDLDGRTVVGNDSYAPWHQYIVRK